MVRILLLNSLFFAGACYSLSLFFFTPALPIWSIGLLMLIWIIIGGLTTYLVLKKKKE